MASVRPLVGSAFECVFVAVFYCNQSTGTPISVSWVMILTPIDGCNAVVNEVNVQRYSRNP